MFGNEAKPDEGPAAIQASGGNAQGVIKNLQQLGPFYEDMLKVVSLPQAEFKKQHAALRSKFDANPMAKLILPSFERVYDTDAAARTSLVLLKTAAAILESGPDAAKGITDPVNHSAITYEAMGKGFELKSTVMFHDKPVTLSVGGEKK
jgi:hypothetical protein